ncbi:hypothetical protein K1T71_000181 [Dendrolimus kikuchii]|uniref:Uncharacterized protein n=1 Tax=Dendrolimus kikuchii TaxID=765133 RepID=A0ACC1DII4_9NEOP|nr:hypothetical protein K1T71_000181 [Dendrolimus kikuchii]
MNTNLNLILILWIQQTTGTLVGVSYFDDHNFNKSQKLKPGENPCNPLYWYPKPIPEHCFVSTPAPKPAAVVVPAPVPVPIPIQPLPVSFIPPMPKIPPMPVIPPIPPLMPPFPAPPLPLPVPLVPLPPIPSIDTHSPEPLPFGVPMIPGMPAPPIPRIPYPAYPPSAPYGYPNIGYEIPNIAYGIPNIYMGRRQVGMVPGLPGLVSPDGGINILPFSDVYADMFERYKQKTITKKLKKMGDFNKHPWELWARRRRKRLRD